MLIIASYGSARLNSPPPYHVMRIVNIAYSKAKNEHMVETPIVAVVDYEISANEPRLWIIDMENNVVLKQFHVAHGKYSGFIESNSFSNKPGSLKSSIGVFVTGKYYYGKHGKSIQLVGLDSGFNDNAEKRGIVFHSAHYVKDQCSIKTERCIGRSYGCFAVSPESMKYITQILKPGSLVLAYYPDDDWLSNSDFINIP